MPEALDDARGLYRAALRHCRVAHVLGTITNDEAKVLLIPLHEAVQAAKKLPAIQLEMFPASTAYHL